MKYLSLFLCLFLCTAQVQSQIRFLVSNLPPGEQHSLTDFYKSNVVLVSTKSVFDSGQVIFKAPAGVDIRDARFKLNVEGSAIISLLVLLENKQMILLTKNTQGWTETALDPIPGLSGSIGDKIVGDDLYALTYEGVYVSDSGYNWKMDTAGLNKPQFYDIDIDTFQRVWLCTSNGLFTQEVNVTTWTKNTNYNGIGCDHVFIDRNQNAWVSYYNLIKVSKNRGATFQNAPTGLPSAFIRDICDDAFGNIYVMTDNSLYYSTGGTQPFVQCAQSVNAEFTKFSTNKVFNSIIADTLIYLSSKVGLFTSADKGITWTYDKRVKAEHINSVSVTSTNRLIMTSNTGLFRLEGDNTTWLKKYPQSGFADKTKAFTATNGDIYVLAEKAGTNSGGLNKLMVYKSTDHAVTFLPDTAGVKLTDVGMNIFLVDENGEQHAGGNVRWLFFTNMEKTCGAAMGFRYRWSSTCNEF